MELKYLQNNLAQIKKAITQDRLVIFAGAGVSFDSGLLLWSQLINKIKKKLDFDTHESDPLKLAQLLYNEKGEKEYNEILRNLIFESSTTANPIHKILFELNPQHIVTTNYDYFFEEVIDHEGLPFSVISKDPDLPYADHKNLLIKYHGDFNNKNIVLKETDYLEFSNTNILKETFVKSLFSNKVILFVGYSFSDINLKILLREVQHLLKKHKQKAYLITPEIEVPNSEKSYFNNFGINIINYNPELFAVNPPNGSLSTKGQKVYSILNYLSKIKLFDNDYSLTEEASFKNVVETSFESLKRFGCLSVLPKSFLASLYPFNKDSKQPPNLNVDEDRLIFFSRNIYDALVEVFSASSAQNELSKQAYYIKKILLGSGINEIAYAGKPKGLGQYIPNENDIYEINWKEKGKVCDCFGCLLDRFEYQKILKKSEAYRISSSTEILEDLKYSYLLYKIGDYLKSFKSFQDLLQKSNKQGRFDVSFLAKFNLFNLSKFLVYSHVDNDEIGFEDYENLKQVGSSYDLDRELEKLKFFYDKDVYRFYKDLNNGKIVHRLCIDLDSLKVTTLETLDRIKGGGSGGASFTGLLNRMKELDNFLNFNYIIEDNFYEVNHSFQKSFESIIVGYLIKDIPLNSRTFNFGKPHIKYFNFWISDILIRRADPENLYKILRKSELQNIKFHEDEINKLYNHISQFLNNAYEQNKFFGGKSESLIFKTHFKGKETFYRFIDRQFSNICILLSFLELDEKALFRYFEPLTEFLRYAEFKEVSSSLKFVNIFLIRKGHLIPQKEKKELLIVIYERYKLNNCFYSLLTSCSSATTLEFLDVKWINFHVTNFSSKHLYPMLDDRQKVEYREYLKAEVEKENNTYYLYYDAIENEVISDVDFINQFKQEINSILKLELSNKSENIIFFNHHIHLFLVLYFENKVDLSLIESDNIFYKYYQFLFDLKNYPPMEFEPEWLNFSRPEEIDREIVKAEYIFDSTEKYLLKEEDPNLERIYFNLKRIQN
ncbi:SIR2 family protein [Salinimicrobium sp. CAU 1759]